MVTNAGQLSAFLRARRARVQPDAVGLPQGRGIRRTPGLRREELAVLAGVSIDYLTRLEQGKETNPSTASLDALAAALLLDPDAHVHLYALADEAAHRIPPRRSDLDPEAMSVRPPIEQLLDRLRPAPTYVLDPISDISAANPEDLALFTGIIDWPRRRRNTIRYLFVHPAARDLCAPPRSGRRNGSPARSAYTKQSSEGGSAPAGRAPARRDFPGLPRPPGTRSASA